MFAQVTLHFKTFMQLTKIHWLLTLRPALCEALDTRVEMWHWTWGGSQSAEGETYRHREFHDVWRIWMMAALHKTTRERPCRTLQLHIDFVFDFLSPLPGSLTLFYSFLYHRHQSQCLKHIWGMIERLHGWTRWSRNLTGVRGGGVEIRENSGKRWALKCKLGFNQEGPHMQYIKTHR